jgi:hypothetical protein
LKWVERGDREKYGTQELMKQRLEKAGTEPTRD